MICAKYSIDSGGEQSPVNMEIIVPAISKEAEGTGTATLYSLSGAAACSAHDMKELPYLFFNAVGQQAELQES